MKYVIIGASAAGAQAAEELRKLDTEGSITVLTEEPSLPYSRCLISRFVDGRLREDNLFFKTKNFYNDNRIEAVQGTKALSIDRTAKQIIVEKNDPISYDRLLIATGSRPTKPNIPGMSKSGVFMFHSLHDAHQVLSAAHTGNPVVVVGAGFAGLEAAYALQLRGCKVTVIERCSQILPNQLDREGGDIIKKDLENLGIELVFDQSVASIEGSGDQIDSILLANNIRIQCANVVFATGIRPNKEIAAESGLITDKGIVVNDYMQTSDPDIFAAGDVIEINDVASGNRVVSATWFNAVLQGKYAAFNMAGKPRRYIEGIGIQNAVQFHRVPAISFGQTLIDAENQDDYDVMSIRSGRVYKKLLIKGNRIVGMIFVGDIAKSGFYAALIRQCVDISQFKSRLLDDDFSHALFARELTFGQYDPYRGTAPHWNGDAWWAERSKCITG